MSDDRKTRADAWQMRLTEEQRCQVLERSHQAPWHQVVGWIAEKFGIPAPSRAAFYRGIEDIADHESEYVIRRRLRDRQEPQRAEIHQHAQRMHDRPRQHRAQVHRPQTQRQRQRRQPDQRHPHGRARGLKLPQPGLFRNAAHEIVGKGNQRGITQNSGSGRKGPVRLGITHVGPVLVPLSLWRISRQYDR